MTRVQSPKHGDTHRPPGTLGPSDLGGSDPITTSGGGAYTLIEKVVVASNGDPIVFSSIPQTFETLQLKLRLRTHNTPAQLGITWNSHVGSNYDMGWIKVDTASTITGQFQGDSYVGVTVPDVNDDTTTDPLWTYAVAEFPFYSLASAVKGVVWQGTSIAELTGSYSSGGGQSVADVDSSAADSAAITQIELCVTTGAVVTGQWAAGSRASLYGIT